MPCAGAQKMWLCISTFSQIPLSWASHSMCRWLEVAGDWRDHTCGHRDMECFCVRLFWVCTRFSRVKSIVYAGIQLSHSKQSSLTNFIYFPSHHPDNGPWLCSRARDTFKIVSVHYTLLPSAKDSRWDQQFLILCFFAIDWIDSLIKDGQRSMRLISWMAPNSCGSEAAFKCSQPGCIWVSVLEAWFAF